jgi:alpha-mannosidase
LHRYKEANEIADGIENMIEKKIAESLKLTSKQIILFNTDPHEFKGRKSFTLLTNSKHIKVIGITNLCLENEKYYPLRDHILIMTAKGQEYSKEPAYYKLRISGEVQLPALGYKVFNVVASDNEDELCLPKASQVSDKAQISDGNYVLSFDHGKINLKVDGILYKNILSLVDNADDGDTYDYSPLANDKVQTLPLQKAATFENTTLPTIIVYGAAKLPKTLEDRISTTPEYGDLIYKIKMSLDKKGRIEAHISLNNQVLSHNLRLRFSPKVKTDSVLAEIQAGYQNTKNQEIPNDWQKKFVEKPVNIFNFDKSVTLTNSEKHFTIWDGEQKTYQYENGNLYITLMATTGELGKANLEWRPGRASGDTTNQGHIMMKTPIAQELGLNEFNFAFQLENKPFDYEANNVLTNNWLRQSVFYQLQTLNVFINRLDNKIWDTNINHSIPKKDSILDLPANINVSALYPSYDDNNSYIIRIQNMTDHEIKLPKKLYENGEIVNALEEKMKQTSSVDPFDIVSVKMKLK